LPFEAHFVRIKPTQKDMQNDTQKVIETMSATGVHFGALRSRRHPSTSPYVFGAKGQVEIIDLEKSLVAMEKAKEFLRTLAKERKPLLIVGNKNEARQAVKDIAESANLPYVALRWIGGTLTNAEQIKKRVDRLVELRNHGTRGDLMKYTKRERAKIAHEVKDLERYFTGIIDMKQAPGALLVIDPKKEEIAIAEARKVNIPVVALANTDCDISGISYPIVGNDKTLSSISFVLRVLVQAYKEGLSKEGASV
jgi:small subunit ribosomal protein S2